MYNTINYSYKYKFSFKSLEEYQKKYYFYTKILKRKKDIDIPEVYIKKKLDNPITIFFI